MTDESKPLIVEGEEVGEYSDTHFYFSKWQMATVELWESPKEFDAYQYDWEVFKEFYKEENEDYKYVCECEEEDFTPGMNGVDTIDLEKWLLEFCEKTDWIKDEYYFIVHWRRYASYTKEVYEDGQEEWCLEDMGESNPDRYQYKDGKIEGHWDTPMEEDEYE